MVHSYDMPIRNRKIKPEQGDVLKNLFCVEISLKYLFTHVYIDSLSSNQSTRKKGVHNIFFFYLAS